MIEIGSKVRVNASHNHIFNHNEEVVITSVVYIGNTEYFFAQSTSTKHVQLLSKSDLQ